ncbi:hypothetical protein EGR_08286 [Echinococcus granulosus]|uniref:Uncharacterized protein n=1 Tax=Echinococcus granulosus TaxID=6210 RepID=W6U6N8_ECHGR|nr:hypothetical protein EGR_08286 [Echinococcus granulosus]EUB56880.1 hypothetical protein EGR_08286 [Echinococcus granulosus]
MYSLLQSPQVCAAMGASSMQRSSLLDEGTRVCGCVCVQQFSILSCYCKGTLKIKRSVEDREETIKSISEKFAFIFPNFQNPFPVGGHHFVVEVSKSIKILQISLSITIAIIYVLSSQLKQNKTKYTWKKMVAKCLLLIKNIKNVFICLKKIL